jgi:hypothetical protein
MVKGLGTVKTYKLSPKQPTVKRTATLAAPPLQPVTGGYCEREACPYRGLSAHLARVRVQELVRAGLWIEDAARFVRENCA